MRFRSWLRELATLVMIRLFTLGILVAAGIAMPLELNRSALLLAAGVLALMLWSIYGGGLQLLRGVGALGEPPARLVAIVTQVAARMRLPLPRMWLLRIFGANALALPVLNTLLVTEGAMETLTDDELSAICAHEFAHLNEPKSVVTARIFTALSSLPAIFMKPAFHAWGLFGCIAIGVVIILISRFSRGFRNRMEKRADSMATMHEGAEPGTYARALEKIYEANQVPAVMGKKMVHPSLYDRLLAAGVTPAYPRPAPPPRFSWQRGITMALLGVSVFIGIQRIAHDDDEKRARRPRNPATQWPRP
jgi:Zn-dependent protease with chaperone function